MINAELISVGNELLIGKVVNTNANWLARRITELGAILRRVQTVGDDLDEISDAIELSLSRGPFIIITTGGLGPTYDDMTLAGIAKALGIELSVNQEALTMIKEKYASISMKLTPARAKMANLPKGGVAIANPVGTAPGCLIEFSGVKIVSLPGVPLEMEAMFSQSVAPILAKASGRTVFAEASILFDGIPESALAPMLDEVRRRHAPAYFKSHPKMSEGKPLVEVHISARGTSRRDAEEAVRRGFEDLKEALAIHGAKIVRES